MPILYVHLKSFLVSVVISHVHPGFRHPFSVRDGKNRLSAKSSTYPLDLAYSDSISLILPWSYAREGSLHGQDGQKE